MNFCLEDDQRLTRIISFCKNAIVSRIERIISLNCRATKHRLEKEKTQLEQIETSA